MPYGKTNRESVESANVGGGADFWNPPEGESRIRVMPPWDEQAEEFWFVTGTHFNVGPDERPVPCPDLSGVADSCFLCRLVKRLARGDEDEAAEAEAMGARPRYLLNIVDLEKPQDGVQVWPAPKTIFRQLKKYWLNEEDYGDFTSFKEGFDIIIDKTGSGINTKYDSTPTRPKEFPSDKLINHRSDTVGEMYEQLANEEFELPNLAEVQGFQSDEEMERTYKGLSGGRSRTEENGGSDPEPEPEPEAEPEQTEADPEPEQTETDPEPEAEAKPRRRRRAAAEEPEETAADPEAEPEPKPRRRRAATSEKADPEPAAAPKRRARKAAPKSGSKAEAGSSRVRGRVKDLE